MRVIAATASTVPLRVSGEGRNLSGGKDATDGNVVVLYATPETVALLSGVSGYQSLAFRLADTRPAAVAATTAAVRRALARRPGLHRLHVAAGGARAGRLARQVRLRERSPSSST